jgi:hypothetical protein
MYLRSSTMPRSLAIFVFFLLSTVIHAQDASLKMRFVFDGDAPAPKQFRIPRPIGPIGTLIDERLLVDPSTNGIRNVVVFLDDKDGNVTRDMQPHESEQRQLTMRDYRFDPHVLVARAGDELELRNQGPSDYLLKFVFFENQQPNIHIAAGVSEFISPSNPERGPARVECAIHPWMSARLVILEHSFAAVSDEDGELTIEGLPAGKKLTFRVNHEAGRIDQVRFWGKKQNWSRNRLTLELQPGLNDLGDILVPAEALLPKEMSDKP